MSRVRTKPAESATKREARRDPHARAGRVTRSEFSPAEPLLEYISPTGGNRKWCSLYFGGESRAGD